MTKLLDVYKCDICGNIVELVHPGADALVCCGQPMKHMVADSVDAAQEKHVPSITKTDNGYHVQIGSAKHPMTLPHHIEWIELIAGERNWRKFLDPTAEPEATFEDVKADKVTARAYCNLHGLWEATFPN